MLTLLTIVCTVGGYAQEKVILDFSKADWNFPETPNANKTSYTCNDGYTITFGANSGHKKQGNGILMGKKGATLSLPAFDFDVEKIILKKNTGSVSANVTFNIFVDNTAVSTQAKGCDKDKTFIIKDEFQKAGNIYTIKVTNVNNLQTSAIEIYKKAATTPPPLPPLAPTLARHSHSPMARLRVLPRLQLPLQRATTTPTCLTLLNIQALTRT